MQARIGAALGLVMYVVFVAACASSESANGDADAGDCPGCAADAASGPRDGAGREASVSHDAAADANVPDGGSADASIDAAMTDTAAVDSARETGNDTGSDTGGRDTGPADSGVRDASVGVITGGPCISGAAGATAYRVRWADAGGTAQAVYEVDGLPDRSRDHASANGYQIGFTPQFVDPFLGVGGLQLDSSDFVDIEISTAGVSSITSATLSIFGRSFDTTTSGSFNWQTFMGTGSSPTDSVSNVAPYQWYSADMTTEIRAGDNGVLVRIKAGPSSGALVVNRIEICMQAN